MDAPAGPTTNPFSFVLIPCADAQEVQQQRYEGHSDEELKRVLKAYFARNYGAMNESQKAELQSSLKARLEESKKRDAAKQAGRDGAAPAEASRVQVVDDDDDSAKTSGDDGQKADLTSDLLAHAVNSQEDGAFEIVPVVMPAPRNKFVATSLYIDQTGMFKDLPVNSRASRLVGREVRGDAFLLSNHDDPALDAWERVDTTTDDFRRLHENPPTTQHDLNSDGGNAAALAQREDFSRVVSAEDAAKALQCLADGRAAFAAQRFADGVSSFGDCFRLLNARTDLLPNDQELQQAKTIAALNGAACALKLERWQDAEALATIALSRDPSSEKAAFRLCTAKVKLRDYDAAKQLVATAKQKLAGAAGSSDPQQQAVVTAWQALEQELLQSQAAFQKQERAKFSKMFG